MRAPGSYVGLTEQQAEMLSFLRISQAEGTTPSFTEMGNALGWKSRGNAHRIFNSLVERGYVERRPGRSRSYVVHEESVFATDILKRFSTGQILAELRRRGVEVGGGEA